MAEGGEGPVQLKDKDVAQLQRVAPIVVLGEAAKSYLDEGIDKKRYEQARRTLEIGTFADALRISAGDGPAVGRNVNSLIRKFGEHDATDKGPDHKRAKEGLDALDPILKAKDFKDLAADKQEELRKQFISIIKGNPNFAQYNFTDNQVKDFAEQCLNNPRFRDKIVGALREVQGMSLTPHSEIQKAKGEVRKLDAKIAEADKRGENADAGVRRANDRLGTMSGENAPKNPQQDAVNEQLEEARNDLRQISADLKRYKDELQEIDERYRAASARQEQQQQEQQQQQDQGQEGQQQGQQEGQNLNQGTITYDAGKVAILNAKIERLTADERQAKQDVLRYTKQLSGATQQYGNTDREDRLEDRLSKQEDRAIQAVTDKTTAESDKIAAELHVTELEEHRKEQEAEIADAIQGVFSTAAAGFIQEQLKESMDALTTGEAKVKEEANEAVAKALKRHMEHRWGHEQNRKRGIFGRQRKEFVRNRPQINNDFNQLLRDGDTDLMRTILTTLRPKNKDGSSFSLTKEQVDDLLKKDGYGDKMKSDVIKNVVAQRALIRRFTPAEVQQMMQMPSVKDSVQDSLNTNEEFRARVRELTGTDDMDLDNTDFKTNFAKVAISQPGLLLFPITAIPWAVWSAVRANSLTKRSERDKIAAQI